MRSDNFLIAIIFLDFAQHILQAQTKVCSLGEPDGQTLTHTVGEHEEFHLLTDLSVVALLGLFEHHEILVEHLLLGEGNTVDTRHLLALGIAARR